MASDPAKLIARSARSFTDPAERSAYLDRVCRGIVRLRAEVEALLAAEEAEEPRTPRAAEESAVARPPVADEPPEPHPADAPHEIVTEKAGDAIGRYTLVKELGQGGFGTVWMAEQVKPVRRRVALKIIKLGMDTQQVVSRFEQERQALALMDHPNIARVLDAGATASGRPYFVMDLVQGVPMNEYCDQERLTIEARLDLFAQVCTAVQHAHQRGIIHRDLKPSNVLVATRDGKPHATVIDFGIAKATTADLSSGSQLTEQYQIIGTLQYMSPEQAQGSVDIDTRTDVYSLGALLYELLTGSTPFDEATMQRAMFGEIQRMIREDDPPAPSARITQSRDTLAGLAATRRMEPSRLPTLLRGELDWIAMRALEKDRARRYESAGDLAADVRRYLSGEAVLAAPPSTSYRIRKFVRRHKATVAAASAIAASLVAGVVAFAWQAGVARDERDRAVAARAETSARAKELQMVANFQAAMLSRIDKTQAGTLLAKDVLTRHAAALAREGFPEAERNAKAEAFAAEWRRVNAVDTAVGFLDREILAPAVLAVNEQFRSQPVVDAQLRSELASGYFSLGLFDAALPLAEQALATRRRALGDSDADTLSSLCDVGWIQIERARHPEAEACLREAATRARAALGPDHDVTRAALGLLGTCLGYRGKYAELEPLHLELLQQSRRLYGEHHPTTLSALSNYAITLSSLGRDDEAAPMLREVMAASRRVHGEDHPETLIAIANYQSYASDPEREALCREVLDKRRRVLGEEHFETVWSMYLLAGVLKAAGKLEESEVLCRDALARMRRVRGEDHTNVISVSVGLAGVLGMRGQAAEAESLLRNAAEKGRRLYGSAIPETQAAMSSLSRLLEEQKRFSEAEPLLRELLAAEQAAAPDGAGGSSTRLRLADALLAQAKYGEAEPLLSAAYEDLKKRETATAPDGRRVAKMLDRFIALYTATGRPADAEKWRAERAKYPDPAAPAETK